MTQIRRVAGLALVAVSLPALAGITQDNAEKTQAVIAAVVEAYGGAERLDALNSLVTEADTITWAVNQSRRPEPPWDRSEGRQANGIDFAASRFYARGDGNGGGFEFDGGTLIDGEAGYALDFRGGTAAPIAQPDFDTAAGPFIRITPALLVKQLQARGNASHHLGVESVDGRPHDVISLVMTTGPAISLFVDQETHLVTRSERLLPPFGLVEYRFSGYEEIDGVPMNRRFRLAVNGDPSLDWKFTRVSPNGSLEEFVAAAGALAPAPTVTTDELSLNEVADGVFLVGGNGTYVLFVENEDYVVAVDGTAGVPERIAELRKHVGDKPIRYAALTHHHNDHVLGVPTYVEEGATLVVAKAHEGVIRQAAGEGARPKFEFVDGSRTLGKGAGRVELIDLGPNPHAEHILAAWLPGHGILFHADMVNTPLAGPLPPAVANTEALADVIGQRKLAVKTVLGAHSPQAITMADLRLALDSGV